MEKNNNRKYYLNKKVKEFVSSVDAYNHTIYLNEQNFNVLPNKKQKYLFELRDKFNYSIQYVFV